MELGGETIAPEEAASLLSWWLDAGVDTLIDETPRDWLRPVGAAAPSFVIPAKAGTQADTSPRNDADWVPAFAGMTKEEDTPPDQIELFRAWLQDSASLPFATPKAPRVCPSGDPASGLMILADMPTGDDCTGGTLLSGHTGRLFDRMLAAIGRDRNSIYLASLSCLRAPGGRMDGEAGGRCAALARHHVGLVQPRVLLLLGDAPAQALLGLNMAQARGRWHDLSTHAGPVKAMVTLAPDLLLRSPRLKAHAWADLQMLMQGPTP